MATARSRGSNRQLGSESGQAITRYLGMIEPTLLGPTPSCEVLKKTEIIELLNIAWRRSLR